MPLFIDLTGNKYNSLKVIKRVDNKRSDAQWLCECDCGNLVNVVAYRLKDGNTKSCGCAKKMRNVKHGKSKTIEYQTWNSMMQRCFNSKSQKYDAYGARGITVCDRWLSFENFLEDMGVRPSNSLSLERINVNGNYNIDNCKWGTNTEQSRNRRVQINNKTGYNGIFLDKRRNRWVVRIKVDGKTKHIGQFKEMVDAIEARKQAEITYWSS